ncbi:MAG: hypothetical protein ACI9BK_003251 [Acidimicrobiales bacterium]
MRHGEQSDWPARPKTDVLQRSARTMKAGKCVVQQVLANNDQVCVRSRGGRV